MKKIVAILTGLLALASTALAAETCSVGDVYSFPEAKKVAVFSDNEDIYRVIGNEIVFVKPGRVKLEIAVFTKDEPVTNQEEFVVEGEALTDSEIEQLLRLAATGDAPDNADTNDNVPDANDDSNDNLPDANVVDNANAPEAEEKTPQEATAPQSDLSRQEEVLRLVNVERAKVGAQPLELVVELLEGAQIRATELPQLFSHTRPDGTNFDTVLTVRTRFWGENIAAGNRTPAEVVDAWMHSPGHRANILNRNYQYLGVGYHYEENSQYGYYWVQIFGG